MQIGVHRRGINSGVHQCRYSAQGPGYQMSCVTFKMFNRYWIYCYQVLLFEGFSIRFTLITLLLLLLLLVVHFISDL